MRKKKKKTKGAEQEERPLWDYCYHREGNDEDDDSLVC